LKPRPLYNSNNAAVEATPPAGYGCNVCGSDDHFRVNCPIIRVDGPQHVFGNQRARRFRQQKVSATAVEEAPKAAGSPITATTQQRIPKNNHQAIIAALRSRLFAAAATPATVAALVSSLVAAAADPAVAAALTDALAATIGVCAAAKSTTTSAPKKGAVAGSVLAATIDGCGAANSTTPSTTKKGVAGPASSSGAAGGAVAAKPAEARAADATRRAAAETATAPAATYTARAWDYSELDSFPMRANCLQHNVLIADLAPALRERLWAYVHRMVMSSNPEVVTALAACAEEHPTALRVKELVESVEAYAVLESYIVAAVSQVRSLYRHKDIATLKI